MNYRSFKNGISHFESFLPIANCSYEHSEFYWRTFRTQEAK